MKMADRTHVLTFRYQILADRKRASAGENHASPSIEDDPTVTKSIELMLKCEDIDVQTTELGQDGLDLGSVFLYDLILLDLNLPDMSGFDVLRSLRLGKIKTPVLILSGLNGVEQKVKGLGLGADDYVTKPFQSDELIARIRAILRRSGDGWSGDPLWRSDSEA